MLTRNTLSSVHCSCKVSTYTHDADGRLTVSALADLVRGLGKGAFAITETGKKGRSKQSGEKGVVDLRWLCGGKVEMSGDVSFLLAFYLTYEGCWWLSPVRAVQDTENLIMYLILNGFLQECSS
jgi:hypothetical protein